MAFVFPEDKADFTAPNGVTYAWDGAKWVTKTFKADESALAEYVKTNEFEADQTRQDDHDNVQDSQINALEAQVQLLAGVKAVGRWTYRRRIEGSSVRPPNLKTFYGTNVLDVSTVLTSWEDTNLLMVSKTDIDNNTFAFSEFEEGDKVEVIAVDGSSAVYGTVTNNPNNDSYGNFVIDVERWRGGPVEETEYLISAYRPGSSNDLIDLDILDSRYLVKTGDEMSGALKIKRGDEKIYPQWKISPNGGTDYATNIYSLQGPMRFRTSKSGDEVDHVGSHIVLDPDAANGGANQTTKIYKVPMPNQPDMAASKAYVDQEVASVGGGVPAGCIMIWMNTDPPDGWFKLHGGTFDTIANPQLHAYLSKTHGYVAGNLPDWSGRYPGEHGGHLTGALGTFANPRTAKPSAGSPYSSTSIPNGNTRTFNGAGGTSAYSDGAARPSIDSGWDSTTRPLTVVVHYIIKGG